MSRPSAVQPTIEQIDGYSGIRDVTVAQQLSFDMTGSAVQKFLKSKGANIRASVISRMKKQVDDKLHGVLQETYQGSELIFN
ncbi:hypothetical protein ON010_g3581 [Phytophthora cinnamomi]|nr:hypothetical protein ON010_g3581 [Phytophthora cinnamomi]